MKFEEEIMAISATRKMVLHEMLVQYVKDMDAMNAADNAYKAAIAAKTAADKQHNISRASFGLFGYTGEKQFDNLKEDIGADDWSAAFAEARTPPADEDDEPTDFDGADDVPDEPVPDGMPTIREMVLDRLKEAGDEGTKARPIRAFVEDKLGRELHAKTVGMTLYRLSKEGLARSEGHTWFLVEAEAETGNPGAVTPGSKDGSKGKEDA
jgi:hypothetical protein